VGSGVADGPTPALRATPLKEGVFLEAWILALGEMTGRWDRVRTAEDEHEDDEYDLQCSASPVKAVPLLFSNRPTQQSCAHGETRAD
jgi:hypothetical protein